MEKWLKWLWVGSIVVMIVQMAVSYSFLPERMATHFDLEGNPDGWSSRTSFVLLWVGLIVIINCWVPLTGKLMTKLPPGLTNLPNRDYWMSEPARREVAIGIVTSMMQGIFLGVNICFILLYQYTIDVNVDGSSDINMWVGIGFAVVVPVFFAFWGLNRLGKTE